MAQNLIIYYSRKGQNYFGGAIRSIEKGNTEYCAEFIRDAVGGDLFEVDTVEPYAEDYMECTEEAMAELRAKKRPELKAYLDDISGYDNIFVCGPCWWGTYPMAIFSQLDRLDLKGKKIMALITHEGSGLGQSEKDLKKAYPEASFGKGLAIQGSTAPNSRDKVAAWAKSQI
jgi:flavodoxin